MSAAEVVRLARRPEKGRAETLGELVLLESIGVEGDFAKGGDRQVSLLTADARKAVEAQSARGLCFGRFVENILVDGLNPEEMREGALLYIGGAVLQVSPSKKKCHDGCAIRLENARCPLSECVRFAAVIEGGLVRIGDGVKVIKK